MRTAALVKLLEETAEEWDDNPEISGLLAIAGMEIHRLQLEVEKWRKSGTEAWKQAATRKDA